jgi:hypothetical protein
MGSEITVKAKNIDLPGLMAELLAVSKTRLDLKVSLSTVEFQGPIRCLWGRRLTDDNEKDWLDAQEEADAGDGTIETIKPSDGSPAFDAIVFNDSYRDLVLAALQATGDPVFDYQTTFDLLEIQIGQTKLELGFDQQTANTASPVLSGGKDDGLPGVYLWTSDGWNGQDHSATAADHMDIISLIDILGRHCELDVYDSTDFYTHRDETGLVAAMAEDRQMRAELRRVFREIAGLIPPEEIGPPLTIEKLLSLH